MSAEYAEPTFLLLEFHDNAYVPVSQQHVIQTDICFTALKRLFSVNEQPKTATMYIPLMQKKH